MAENEEVRLKGARDLQPPVAEAAGSASRVLDERSRRCVLCGKPREHVAKLIVGLHGGICAECVRLCVQVLEHDVVPPRTEVPRSHEEE